MYGLNSEQWKQIYHILDEHRDDIRWVKLFGSRARGDYRETSDVDLAIGCERDLRGVLKGAFEQSRLPYTFDIVLYDDLAHGKLRDRIDAEGRLLFCIDKGKRVMTVERIHLKWENYHRALGRLQTALEKDADTDDMYLDATIQRFEFCFELAWKLMKVVLEYEGSEVNSPRSTIREAWKQGLIADAEAWLDMMEKRNLSAHTYDEHSAWGIYRVVKERYIALLTALDAKMQESTHRSS
ncbi:MULTISPECIES: HI0074 family nucleotidyltransferase substrate-binding subunit [Selenomonas]|uniref:HI0074 family nucleotidyltransferase substrate-binding subunit n=1 Tax=Selenomonas TaxID=970 RepID=UPI0001E0C60C|nr:MULTISPECIES: HI0074 family nucleotidyltransferase substrate-binding subunit [Selenomonas]EFM22104.1 nucleotidyltransferase substrate-binding family protein [Selenomonas sp. oral taxon 149 str. 67H29BP]